MNFNKKSSGLHPLQRLLSASLLTLLLVIGAGSNGQTPTSATADRITSARAMNGKIAFTSTRDGNSEIYVMNPDGTNQIRLTTNPGSDETPAWSPDGSRIAFRSIRDGVPGIFVMNASGSNQTRLTNIQDYDPAWSPDGSRIAFARSTNDPQFTDDIHVMNADGSNQTRFTNNRGTDGAPSWSPDGSRIAFTCSVHICVMNADGSNPITFVGGDLSFGFAEPSWSPDGSKIAYSFFPIFNDQWDDPSEIFVRNADRTQERNLTQSVAKERSPAWSPDGSKVAFSVWNNPYLDLGASEIFTMNSDGSGRVQLTSNPGSANRQPSWQPLVLACLNAIDCTEFFVRQHYLDFLNRDPDPAGYAGWQDILNNCPIADTTCDRIHVSSAFFRSPEFQGRGYFVYRFYPVAFGRKPDYDEFSPDFATVSGFLTDAELEAAKLNFIAEFMNRPPFLSKFTGLSNTEYVDALLSSADITHPSRDSWITALNNSSRTRAQVLREIAESTEVYNKYYNQAFVVMQYFGYLRRQPDALYLNWIAHLEATGDYRSMIHGFMNSIEYRSRFGS